MLFDPFDPFDVTKDLGKTTFEGKEVEHYEWKDKILKILNEIDHPERKKFAKRKTQESKDNMAIAAATEIRKQIMRTRT